jgi:hypothetical protein
MNIFLIAKTKFRNASLNNFKSQKKFGQFKLYNFIGPYLYYIGKLLVNLKVGKAISFDGRPILKKKEGVNLWMGGTIFKIPSEYQNLKNNFVNSKSIFYKKKEKLFQLFPIKIAPPILNRKIYIIYISELKITEDLHVLQFWNKNKFKLFKDFTTIDNEKFWKQFNFFNNKIKCFSYYRKIKNLLRLEIVKRISTRYSNFKVIGNCWEKFVVSSSKDIRDPKLVSNLYRGNICLDLGTKGGSESLNPRSINIIESAGALIQLKQNDSQIIWKKNDLQRSFTFSTFEKLFFLIDKILKKKKLIKQLVESNCNKFYNSSILIENELNKVFLD